MSLEVKIPALGESINSGILAKWHVKDGDTGSPEVQVAVLTERIANAVCCCMPCTERDLRVAEAYG